jgi:hypothetical protein
MDVVRRASILATAGSLGLAIMLGSVPSRPALSASAATRMRVATDYFDSTIVLARNARPRGARGDALTVGLGYLERERLGLASPFKLVDEAQRDPRIDPWIAARVTWGMLARVRRGEAYVVDPAALDGIGPWAADGRGATGSAHLALIERTIASSDDPRVGELAIRLAYEVAVANASLAPGAIVPATQSAALIRDRRLAERDLRDLFAAATERHVEVMTLLGEWRAARAFRVEQPSMTPLTSEQRAAAMNAVPALVGALDTLDRASPAPTRAAATRSLLGRRFAERLVALAAARPTMAQLAVPLRADTALNVSNDEAFAASLALVRAAADSVARATARAQLAGAVAMRTMNQAAPWFVGDGGPDMGDLSSEFGVASVAFSRTIPSAWRPYYMRELQSSLRDMRDVFPALSFEGLSVAFGTTQLADSALAMHDPRTRTVRLTIGTSAGTLAHELAHDLDWQTARRLFASHGGYSTDRAVSEKRGALAASLRGLSASRTRDRPTEVFARGADWFVASALASRGRSNGFLTAVQDASLPGYAAGSPAAVGASGAQSLMSALDQMTFVPDSLREDFTARWSDARTVDPVVFVRRVVSAPVSFRLAWSRPIPLPALDDRDLLCVSGDSPELEARERLMLLAIDARAHGVAVRRARHRRAPWDPAAADRLEPLLRMAIAGDLRNSSASQGIVPAVPAPFTGCW